MDLSQLANIAEIFGTLTIFGGLVFGVVQIREYRRQRYDAVAGELMRSFYDSELTDAVALLQTVDDGLSAAEIRALGRDYQVAMLKVAVTFETMGLLVYRRIAPFDLTVELCGGLVQVMWRKARHHVEDVRVEQSQPSYAEWFQWFAEVSGRYKAKSEPAHLRRADWRP